MKTFYLIINSENHTVMNNTHFDTEADAIQEAKEMCNDEKKNISFVIAQAVCEVCLSAIVIRPSNSTRSLTVGPTEPDIITSY